MNAIVVDDKHRVRLKMLSPGDYYVAEPLGGENILLHKLPPPRRQMSQKEVLTALEESPLKFKTGWDKLKQEVR